MFLEFLEPIWQFVKKIFITFWQEILAFFAMIGISRILNPQNASLITVYGSAFLVLLAVIKAIFGVKTPLIQKFKAKPEKYDKLANDDEYLENLSREMKGIGETMKNVLKSIGSILGKTIHFGWLNKFATGTAIFIINAYYELAFKGLLIPANYDLNRTNVKPFVLYTIGLIVGLLVVGFATEPINKALARIDTKKLNRLIDELKNVNVKQVLSKLTTLDFEISKNKLLTKVDDGNKLLNFLQPILREETYNEWKYWLEKIAKDIDEFEKEQFNEKLKKYGIEQTVHQQSTTQQPTQTTTQSDIKIHR